MIIVLIWSKLLTVGTDVQLIYTHTAKMFAIQIRLFRLEIEFRSAWRSVFIIPSERSMGSPSIELLNRYDCCYCRCCCRCCCRWWCCWFFAWHTHTHTCNIQYVGLCIYLQFFFNRNRTNIFEISFDWGCVLAAFAQILSAYNYHVYCERYIYVDIGVEWIFSFEISLAWMESTTDERQDRCIFILPQYTPRTHTRIWNTKQKNQQFVHSVWIHSQSAAYENEN